MTKKRVHYVLVGRVMPFCQQYKQSQRYCHPRAQFAVLHIVRACLCSDTGRQSSGDSSGLAEVSTTRLSLSVGQ